jgi:hypothetical protein
MIMVISVLTGNSAILFQMCKRPGKIIKDFRKKSAKPILKGAYINLKFIWTMIRCISNY